ncbi:5-formyltetrahydrofolate cyclo-ligase [Buchnera aphidicola]|uniref:5-formyltetrahydrofolate cyclo-ligase n=1 Tax=Buchnera aphidicola str. USDA (Myzus persicae) TaxID=1009856 RepID=W0P0U1_BUCMP|nr:5-formyltetrahydrofolate cyclo-ligase [Buchnera aphidicola]AHG60364.1 Ygfa [Buchnera aphidicola str. USDA (Myzus persicae)]AHG60942.1 Ygfa [Buchnera aphidicola str. W106 (Myzus persicae)]AHG61514.1 Ygfa [Buchnera aphidicola str. G002 (Myzus persicae)]AHG62087.1 Ygfa [Buchnera aphidicola str. F009 (Myzus persicae)]WAI03334.1 MAG: 5-formyltetrahydrofolate cyclo-ligase [Buchnera aphidicola (Myzus persicae)]
MLTKFLKNRKNIRKYMRFMRQSLTITQKYNESIKISKVACNCSFIYNAKNIAVFLPFDGEINTYPFIKKLWLNKKKVFLPVINSIKNKKLSFVRFSSYSILYRNQYNIFEPFFSAKDIISISNLDVVIVPLVAFDKQGSRLGMGGGFYDVCLKDWKKEKFFPIGFSYDFQLVNNIPQQHWDISLPIILTPNKKWIF